MDNAKNQLLEFVKTLGYPESAVAFYSTHNADENQFYSNAVFTLLSGLEIKGIGTGQKKKYAQFNASETVLLTIQSHHKNLTIDWEQIEVEAQAGDALIKLCSYLNEEFRTSAEKSFWLQEMETDEQMVKVFENLQAEKHPAVSILGTNLSFKRKATFVESIIWRKFGQDIIAPSSKPAFKEIATFLEST